MAGLKLNLTEEYPLSKQEDVSGLTEMNGMFLGKEKLENALNEERIPQTSLERELRAQVEWCFDAYGSSPTHLCAQDNVHLHPVIAELLMPLMERYGMRNIRIPCEVPAQPFGYEISEQQLREIERLNTRAAEAKERYAAHGAQTTDHFRGSALAGNASLKNLRHIIGKLLDGTTELMVHPGSACTYGTPFDLDPQRQTELRMLLDPSIREELAERKIQLVSWNDV